MTFDDLLPELLVDVDGCPEVTALAQLRNAARDFCATTHVWTVTLDDFNTVANTSAYALQLPAQSTPVRLARVNVGDEKGVDIFEPETAKAALDCGRQRPFAWLDQGQLRIGPTPNRVMSVSVQLSLKPSLNADEIPDWIAEEHAEKLRAGARERLFAMPRKDWTDLTASQLAAGEFSSGAGAAAINKTKGRARARSRRSTFY